MKQEIKNIIFVCKYNVFRSRIAEGYFNKTNKNKNIKAISRGFIMGAYPDPAQITIAKNMGIEIKDGSNPVNLKELKKSDLIIVVADDIPKIMFNYWNRPIMKKVVIWKIRDEQRMNKNNIKRIIRKIKGKVDKLNRKLEK